MSDYFIVIFNCFIDAMPEDYNPNLPN